MPNSMVKSFASRSGKTVAEVEELWDKYKKEVIDSGMTVKDKNFYPAIVYRLKKKLKLESIVSALLNDCSQVLVEDRRPILARLIRLYESSGIAVKKIIKEEELKDLGIIHRTEIWEGIMPDSDYKVEALYSAKDLSYVGDYRYDKGLLEIFRKHGIKPEAIDSTQNVASIGFSENEKRWYGWSHRAMCGFGIGDKIFEENFGTDTTPFTKHGSRDIKTLDDARVSASNFATCVS